MSTHRTPLASPGVAAITGAARGIGLMYAQRLAARGYALLLLDRRAEELALAARQLQRDGVEVTVVCTDLATPEGREQAASALRATEHLTMLVNNAGTLTMAPLAGTSCAQMTAMVDVNVLALACLSHEVLPIFLARNSGTLINIGSILGFHSLPTSSVYSGTKGYVTNFTRGLQEEVAGSQVRIQLVLPCATATAIWDDGGAPLADLDQSTVMSVADCVDAALAGLDLGEAITLPSVDDFQLWVDYEDARLRLLAATQTNQVARRYR